MAVALDCHWDRQIGAMGGCIWLGIPGREIRAVMHTHGIKRTERLQIHRAVRLFASEACRELNDLEAEKADQTRSNRK